MRIIRDWEKVYNVNIPADDLWKDEGETLKMHSIHAYPAKFPAFLASAALDYAASERVNLNKVADVFCGCGTTALEAKERGVGFWGCDINPIATLISKVKSRDYNIKTLQTLYKKITIRANELKSTHTDHYCEASNRLKYWYSRDNYNALFYIYDAICMETNKGKYRDAFMCIFSSILKITSKWLQKSIKPQIDNAKIPIDPFEAYRKKFSYFCEAVQEMKMKQIANNNEITIVNKSLFETKIVGDIDLLLTSPPYVTSYEYADLHQLSTLWLGYSEDYRELRRGSVGSSYGITEDIDGMEINETASSIIDNLKKNRTEASKLKSVARYYRDMERAVECSWDMLNNNGMSLFVIGDSNMNGVKLANTQHLIESMYKKGFVEIKISKREIGKGICVPYRDKSGRFTNESRCFNEVYHEEYIVAGRKYE